MSLLGDSLLGPKKYSEGESMLLAGYEGMIQREKYIPMESKVRLNEAVQRLVRLHDSQGQPDKAREWRKKLEVQSPGK